MSKREGTTQNRGMLFQPGKNTSKGASRIALYTFANENIRRSPRDVQETQQFILFSTSFGLSRSFTLVNRHTFRDSMAQSS